MSAEYHVARTGSTDTTIFESWDAACAKALTIAASSGQSTIDVVCHSEDEAFNYGGLDAVERYRDDPDASVFERFEIKANCVGMVP